MHIRILQPEDTESTAELLQDMSVHYNGANASSLDAVRVNLLENILGPRSGVQLVVALDGAKVIALAAISILYPATKEKGQLFMKELYVHSAHRSKGIGESMMRWIAGYAVENNCVRFDWTVDAPNKEAIRFYEALGADHVSEKLYYRFTGSKLRALAKFPQRDDA